MGPFGVKDGFVLFSLGFKVTIIATMGSLFSIFGATVSHGKSLGQTNHFKLSLGKVDSGLVAT